MYLTIFNNSVNLFTMNATISENEIPVVHNIRLDIGREFLSVKVPNGWDDVKKISKKVLTYNSGKYTFCGWNSDTLECYFFKPIDRDAMIATVGVATIDKK
jgi:hypothetical protein